jgi:uncharacterized protein
MTSSPVHPSAARLTPRQQQWRDKYGPWAVVTGASDGIGRELARVIAAAGLNVMLVARRKTVLDALAAELNRAHGVETRVVPADLTKRADVEAVHRAADELPVGLFVASAGFGTTGRLIDTAAQQEIDLIDVNIGAVMLMTQHFGRRFAAQRRGGIILLSSLVAFQGVPLSANYAASKAYVQSLAEGLRLELAPMGVDVLSSAPGPIRTGFAARANMQMGLAAGPEEVAAGTLAALGRTGTVRPGRLSWLLGHSLAMLPRTLRTRIMARLMRDMTQHQDAPRKAAV